MAVLFPQVNSLRVAQSDSEWCSIIVAIIGASHCGCSGIYSLPKQHNQRRERSLFNQKVTKRPERPGLEEMRF
jgi:hypothetical protein